MDDFGAQGAGAGDAEKGPRMDPDERRLMNLMAMSLFILDEDKGATEKSVESRRAAFKEAQRAYFGKARRLSAILKKRGVSVSLAELEEVSEEA